MITKEAQNKYNLVGSYKSILRSYIEQRPSGLRQKLARVLGTHKSFISQITNPNDQTPIPARHLQAIFNVCHLSEDDKQRFIEAYILAHPSNEIYLGSPEKPSKIVEFRIPLLKDRKKQKTLELLISETIEKIVKLIE